MVGNILFIKKILNQLENVHPIIIMILSARCGHQNHYSSFHFKPNLIGLVGEPGFKPQSHIPRTATLNHDSFTFSSGFTYEGWERVEAELLMKKLSQDPRKSQESINYSSGYLFGVVGSLSTS